MKIYDIFGVCRHYHAQYNLMYDNVSSILGTRGAVSKKQYGYAVHWYVEKHQKYTVLRCFSFDFDGAFGKKQMSADRAYGGAEAA